MSTENTDAPNVREMYRQLETPQGVHIERCPICEAEAGLWQFSETPDAIVQRVVMCSHRDEIGPQDGIVNSGCLLYMPDEAFYQPTAREAIRYWNGFATALRELRASNAPAADSQKSSPEQQLRAENERLRAALVTLRESFDPADWAGDKRMIDVADEALQGATAPAPRPGVAEGLRLADLYATAGHPERDAARKSLERHLQFSVGDAEFLSRRLARLAKIVGYPLPAMPHEHIAGIAGTILGMMASHIERQAAATAAQPQPVTADAAELIDDLDELASDMNYEGNCEMDQEKQSRAALLDRGVRLLKSLAAATAAQPAQQPLTEGRLMRCITDAGCIGTVKMSFESGPYDIDRPTLNATKLARAIEFAHGIGTASAPADTTATGGSNG